jgi:hypothetical protein
MPPHLFPIPHSTPPLAGVQDAVVLNSYRTGLSLPHLKPPIVNQDMAQGYVSRAAHNKMDMAPRGASMMASA